MHFCHFYCFQLWAALYLPRFLRSTHFLRLSLRLLQPVCRSIDIHWETRSCLQIDGSRNLEGYK